VERWGARVGPASHYFRADGTPIAPVQVSDASGWSANFGMHRADLVDFLAAALPAGVVRCGHRAVAFEEAGEVARVRFANGASAEGAVVVIASFVGWMAWGYRGYRAVWRLHEPLRTTDGG
jgi:salicylate hydroxylase